MKTEQKKRGVSYNLVDKVEFYDPLDHEEHLRYFGELAIRLGCMPEAIKSFTGLHRISCEGEGSALENLGTRIRERSDNLRPSSGGRDGFVISETSKIITDGDALEPAVGTENQKEIAKNI